MVEKHTNWANVPSPLFREIRCSDFEELRSHASTPDSSNLVVVIWLHRVHHMPLIRHQFCDIFGDLFGYLRFVNWNEYSEVGVQFSG